MTPQVVEQLAPPPPVVRLHPPGQRPLQLGRLVPQPPLGQRRQCPRVGLAGGQRRQQRPPRHAPRVRRHRRQLDDHVLQQLLDAVDLARALLDQAGAVARQLAQLADRRRRDEAAADQPVLHQVQPPRAVAHVGLPAGRRLHVGGVGQHDRHAPLLQHVDDRPPEHARRLEGHAGDVVLDEPVGQPLQVGQHRREGPGLLVPLPRGVDHADRRHRRPLVHVDRRAARVDDLHAGPSC
jgi:hypothetical protein